ncbi:cytochrome p450 domain-containing protein [Sarocladium implicatum]|nr:cytochrome p450 domain-containing protein [Sarocladium implicatum]
MGEEARRKIRRNVSQSTLHYHIGTLLPGADDIMLTRFTVQLGENTWVFLNSSRVVRDLLEKRAAIYCSRPPSPLTNDIMSGGTRLKDVFMPYQDVESKQLVWEYLHAPERWHVANGRYANSVIRNVYFGERSRLDDAETKALFETIETFFANAQGGVAAVDAFPSLAKLPAFLQWWRPYGEREFKKVTSHLDNLRKKLEAGDAPECFAKDFLESKEALSMDENQKLFVCGTLLEAGSDTSRVTINNLVAAAATYPEWVKTARKQLDDVCGSNGERLPSWDDKESLTYITAVVKEAFRWRPNVTEIGVPVVLTKDDEYEGYKFPKGTVFTFNTWALSLSPDEYKQPERFWPERHLNEHLNNGLKGHHSFGRRVCVGWKVGELNVWIAAARLLYCFDFHEKLGQPIDTMRMPITSSPDGPFALDVKVRSPAHAALIQRDCLEQCQYHESLGSGGRYPVIRFAKGKYRGFLLAEWEAQSGYAMGCYRLLQAAGLITLWRLLHNVRPCTYTPELTTMFVSRVDTSSDAQEPYRQKRLVLSCLECHKRKQKVMRPSTAMPSLRSKRQEICLYQYTKHPCPSDRTTSTDSASVQDPPTVPASQPPFETTPSSNHGNSTALLLSSRLGYSRNSHAGTLGMVSQVGELDDIVQAHNGNQCNNDAANHYFNLIRQIPARQPVNILVQSFFANISWQYDVIDEAMFRNELSIWNQVSYATLKEGPGTLPVNTRCFPALLLQIISLAMLYQPLGTDEALEDLKYAPGVEFADLAADYSNAGSKIMALLGSQDGSIITVQARLMEACFKKSIGSVIEAWHIIGSAIRDAQELGLHRKQLWEMDTSTEPQVPQRPDLILGKRLWFILHLWDAHMGNVLGRPMATQLDPGIVTSTNVMSGSPLLDGSTVAPIDVIFYGYHTAYKYLQDIHNLDVADKSAQKAAQTIHNAIMINMYQLPAWVTASNTALDARYPWLPAARETLLSEIYFVLLALHRVFSNIDSRSRQEGLLAALQILEAQSRLFDQTGPEGHMNFTLVFSTFDAMVFVASTYIRFPRENPDLLPTLLTCMEWGLARLKAMGARNAMAGFAFDVLQVLSQKMPGRVTTPSDLLSSYSDGSGDAHIATQTTLSGQHAGLETLDVGVSSGGSLRQETLYDMVCADLFGESHTIKLASMTASGSEQRDEVSNDSLWQLMDDLT